MEYIGELLKGVVIGIANILPGISGGMLAISMGVYDTIIHAVNRLFKEPVESIRTLFPYGLGGRGWHHQPVPGIRILIRDVPFADEAGVYRTHRRRPSCSV